MKKLRLAESYVKVADIGKAVEFHKNLLGVEIKMRYKDRWVTVVDGFGLYCPGYDKKHNIEMTNIERDLKIGNNSIIVFHSSDIEEEYQRVKNLGVTEISNIADINLMAHYKFFHFKDPDGNMIEIGQYL